MFIHNERRFAPGNHRHICTPLPAMRLILASIFLSLMADEPNVRILFVREYVLSWAVETTCEQMSRYAAGAWKGMIGPGLARWKISNVA